MMGIILPFRGDVCFVAWLAWLLIDHPRGWHLVVVNMGARVSNTGRSSQDGQHRMVNTGWSMQIMSHPQWLCKHMGILTSMPNQPMHQAPSSTPLKSHAPWMAFDWHPPG